MGLSPYAALLAAVCLLALKSMNFPRLFVAFSPITGAIVATACSDQREEPASGAVSH
jgi:hypothetical protein